MATTPEPCKCAEWLAQAKQLCDDVRALIASVHAVLNELDTDDDDTDVDMDDDDTDEVPFASPAKRGAFR